MDQQKPPLPPTGRSNPNQETIKVLQNRLNFADKEAKDIFQNITQITGVNLDALRQQLTEGNPTLQPVISPFKPRIPEYDLLFKNYEMLVSRTCKLESVIQSLKLTLCSVQAEKDLTKKERMSANEKLLLTIESYEKELMKMKKENEKLTADHEDSDVVKEELKKEIKNLKEEMDLVKSEKISCEGNLLEYKVSKEKMMKKVNDLRDDLAREQKLRVSLEESQNTLLLRVKDTENTVETERIEVKHMAKDMTKLRKECNAAREEMTKERLIREETELALKKASDELEEKNKIVAEIEEDKEVILNETDRMKKLYQELNSQLEEVQNALMKKEDTFVRLESENKTLQRALENASQQISNMFRNHDDRMQEEREQFMKSIEKLKAENKERTDLEIKSAELQREINRLTKEAFDKDLNHSDEVKKLQDQISELEHNLADLQSDKQATLKDKEQLLEEVNHAVDDMAEERTRVESELQHAKLDITMLEKSNAKLETANLQLELRLQQLENQQSTHDQVDTVMADMLEQKNKLAYEKGRLQTKVDQFQSELESLTGVQAEVMSLRKIKRTLETKLLKTREELTESKLQLSKMTAKSEQFKQNNFRKEKDFSLAIESRDDAVKEANKLLGQVQIIEDRERGRNETLQKSLEDARRDNQNMASTLEKIMVSHNKLQNVVEVLQTELGRKDSVIAQLSHEKTTNYSSLELLRKQFENLELKYTEIDTKECNEIQPLRLALEECRQDNSKLAGNLQSLLDTNSQLQATIDQLRDDIEQKTYLVEQIKVSRENVQTDKKKIEQEYDERIKNLQELLKKERDKTIKKLIEMSVISRSN